MLNGTIISIFIKIFKEKISLHEESLREDKCLKEVLTSKLFINKGFNQKFSMFCQNERVGAAVAQERLTRKAR